MASAAQSLDISQPTVSRALRILEQGAGASLFHRGPRGLQPSELGERYVLHTRRALNELRHIHDDIAALRGVMRGTLSIGALPLGRPCLLPEAVAGLLATHPGIHVRTDESPYEALLSSLRAGADMDVIVGALGDTDPGDGLRSELLMTDELGVLVRCGDALALRQAVCLVGLAGAQWILSRSHAPARHILDKLFLHRGLPAPQPSVESSDLAMIRGLLQRTDMVAALSMQQVRYESSLGGLVCLAVGLAPPHRSHGNGCCRAPPATHPWVTSDD